jgi:hypothetical protein
LRYVRPNVEVSMGRGSIEGTGMYARVALAWVGEHDDLVGSFRGSKDMRL